MFDSTMEEIESLRSERKSIIYEANEKLPEALKIYES